MGLNDRHDNNNGRSNNNNQASAGSTRAKLRVCHFFHPTCARQPLADRAGFLPWMNDVQPAEKERKMNEARPASQQLPVLMADWLPAASHKHQLWTRLNFAILEKNSPLRDRSSLAIVVRLRSDSTTNSPMPLCDPNAERISEQL